MTIFVGLGNHETKYHNTKHNVGYWVLDSFAKRYGLEFKPGKGNCRQVRYRLCWARYSSHLETSRNAFNAQR